MGRDNMDTILRVVWDRRYIDAACPTSLGIVACVDNTSRVHVRQFLQAEFHMELQEAGY